MTHYAIVTLVVKDEQKLIEYQAVGGSAVAKHGGKPIAGGANTKALSEPHGPTKGVVLSFPNEQNIQDWLDDPDLKPIHQLREEAADVTILSLPAIN